MPYVLVFSGQIKKVVINYKQSELVYQKINPEYQDYFKTVLFTSSDIPEIITYKMIVRKSKDFNVKLAIPLDAENNKVDSIKKELSKYKVQLKGLSLEDM